MAYVSNSFSFGEQVSVNKFNILGSNDAHFYNFLGATLAWSSYSPTIANLTTGNGTLNANYIQLGKTVYLRFSFVFGSTSAVSGTISLPLPIAPGNYDLTNQNSLPWGNILLFDTSAATYYPGIVELSSSKGLFRTFTASGTYATRGSISSIAPFTWATGDTMTAYIMYEGV